MHIEASFSPKRKALRLKTVVHNVHKPVLRPDSAVQEERHLLQTAQSLLYSPDPASQRIALESLLSISESIGFPPGSLPPAVLDEIVAKALGNHDSLRVHVSGLQLIESLLNYSPWTIPFFVQRELDVQASQRLLDNSSGLPPNLLVYVILPIIATDLVAYRRIMAADFLDYLLEGLQLQDTSASDVVWLLTALQHLVISPHFDRPDRFPEIADVALRALGSDAPSPIPELSFYVLARVIAFDGLPCDCLAKVTDDQICSLAIDMLANRRLGDLGAVLDYLLNYVYLSPDLGRRVLSFGFVEESYQLFESLALNLKARVLEVLENIAVDWPDAVFQSPAMAMCPGLLRDAEMAVKAAAMRLLAKVVRTAPFGDVIEFLLQNEVVAVVIDLLDADEAAILGSALDCLVVLVAKAAGVAGEQREQVMAMFDEGVKQRIIEIGTGAPEAVAQQAADLYRLCEVVHACEKGWSSDRQLE
jgi:hypothetical protein